jgi:hypothetical protein
MNSHQRRKRIRAFERRFPVGAKVKVYWDAHPYDITDLDSHMFGFGFGVQIRNPATKATHWVSWFRIEKMNPEGPLP